MGYKVYNNKLKINGEDVLLAAVADTKEMYKIFATKEEVAAGNTASWGNITGEMSAQTDLINVLNNKQNTISDLDDIRNGAAAGATALQSFTETDPTVPSWAKEANKPTYTYDEVGAMAATVTHLSGDIAASEKGANNGVAQLDNTGKVPAAQLPSYVDDVEEYTAMVNFPTNGEDGKIYIDKTTNLTYRWSGSAYVEISQSLALGETSSTAYAGDKGAANAAAISTHTNNTNIHVTDANKTAWNAKYDKPSGGIPKTDLTSDIQGSLSKADTALQSVPNTYAEKTYVDSKITNFVEISSTPSTGKLWVSNNVDDYIEVYTKGEIDHLLSEGIDIEEELADYYTKSETDVKLSGYYTKTQTDSAITTSANGVKALIPTKYSQLTNDANVVTSPNASNIRILTQSEYDAIGAPASDILYLIKAS